MKIKTTRKAIVNSTSKIDLRCAGYCELSTLLRGHSPIAYTCGVYGWNFDVYEVYGKTICTGYRNMPGQHVNNGGEYEKKARAIADDYSRNYDDRMNEVENLLREFCAQC